MIYGEKFLITESKESKVEKYKELLDKSIELLEVQIKWLKIEDETFKKTYDIFIKLNKDNMESGLKQINKITEQSISNKKKIYDFDKFKEDSRKINNKISNGAHFYFTELPLLKDQDIIKYKSEYKNKLNKISNENNTYYNKYKNYIEYSSDSKLYKLINDKSSELYNLDHDLYEKYQNIDGSEVEEWLNSIGSSITSINEDISKYKDDFLLNRIK